MIRNRAIKMRIYPNLKQQHKIDVTLGHCRYVYNKMLERNDKSYKRRGEHLSYYDMQNLLPKMKQYLPWLSEADSQALKYACRQVNDAYTRFFKKQTGHPKFHTKRGRQAYTTTNAKSIHVGLHELKLPCIGTVRTSDTRIPKGSICYATVSKDPDGRYFASITYKEEVADIVPVVPDPDKVVGLDYKSDGLYVDSKGDVANMPHFYRKAQAKRTRLQRELSKKQGFRKGEHRSKAFLKQLRKVNRQASHIANQRRDYLHKLSAEIANQTDAVCVEDLDMKAQAAGNGKATMDNGYGMFLDMLSYKLAERGKSLVKVDRWYPSSQICHICGHRKAMPIKIRTYRCPQCGMVCDRDQNAAINIKAEGLRLLTA